MILLVSLQLSAQVPAPADAQSQSILIRYATAHLGNGSVIENAYLSFENGELSMVSDANRSRINERDYDTIIDAEGKHLYPGFIIMDSRLGLIEIGAVRATHDFDETGDFLPNVRSLPAYNAESVIIPTVRSNGVLMAQVAPAGGRISGSSSAVQLDAWNWEDAQLTADEGMFVNWPARYVKTGWWGAPGPVKHNKKYSEEVSTFFQYCEEARAYSETETHEIRNLRFEAMRGKFDGSKRVYIRVHKAKDILDVVQFVRHFEFEKVTLVGAEEAALVLTELKENGISIVIDRVHKLPSRPEDGLNRPFELPALLAENDIPFAFATAGDMEAMISRNLPFQAGTAVFNGLEHERAIQALTLEAATMLGIEENYGSLQPGKSATFFLCEGDPLDIVGNSIILAFIDGREITLGNRQKELFLKYAKKQGLSVE